MTRFCLGFGFVSTALLPVLTWLAAIGLFPSIPYLSLVVWMPSLIIVIMLQFGRILRISLLPILLVLVWSIFSLGWVDSTERGRGLLIGAAMLTAFGVSVLLWREEAWIKNVKLFIYGTAVVAVVMGAYWVSTGFTNFGTLRDDSSTIVTNRNAVASQLGFAALLALAVLRRRKSVPSKNSKDFVLAAITILLIVSVVLTGSRGGFMSLFAGLMIIALGDFARRKISLATIAVGYGGLWGLLALVIVPNPLRDRLVGADLSQVGDRVPIWEGAVKTFELASIDRWLIGFGTGGADKAVASHVSDSLTPKMGHDGIVRVSTHNAYVEWLVSYGFIGVMLAVIVGAWVIMLVVRSDFATRSVTGLTMLTFFSVYSISIVVYRLPYAVAALALFFGYLSMTKLLSSGEESQDLPVQADRERHQYQQAS